MRAADRRLIGVRRASLLLMLGCCVCSGLSAQENPARRVIASGLSNPFEILVAEDGKLWITERSAGRVLRVDPETGAQSVLAEIPDARASSGGQGGLLGMAFGGEGEIYLAYTYEAPEAVHRLRLSRWNYDGEANRLVDERTLLDGLPASDDHNGGRLAAGPEGKLILTLGDQGANQNAHACDANLAQAMPSADDVLSNDWRRYAGKILRIERDGSIPRDNPVIEGVRSHVFAAGFRNPQGIALANGALYATDQGPKTDDEVNRIEAGGNYGWPFVAGYQDDQAYSFADWSAARDSGCADLAYNEYETPASVPSARESDAGEDKFKFPLLTFGTVENGFDFRDPLCGRLSYLCWPTVAPSGLYFYRAREGSETGWGDSLLVTTLKEGAVYRLPLSGDGTIDGEPLIAVRSADRYRAVAVAEDGPVLYLITDSAGNVRTEDGYTNRLENPGSVIELRWR